jgi:hypothetical protein
MYKLTLMNYIFFLFMNFKIHNLKLKTYNNSCAFVFEVQWYTTSPIHLKNDTKQNKNNYNNNEHKQNVTNAENYILIDAWIQLLQVERNISHLGPSTMP